MTAPAFSFPSDVWPGLAKLVEEAGEVLQVAGKLMMTGGKTEHWDGTDLAVRMSEELGDLKAAVAWFEAHNQQLPDNADRSIVKIALFNGWREEDAR